jgi:Glycoside hydrolase family 44/PA14 domain/Fibronectin type III domain
MVPSPIRFRLVILEDRLAPAVVAVDATANVHPIDPNIYGSAFASTAQLADLNVMVNRDGGNAADTYSFVQDATNHGSDWYYESDPSGSGNGQGMDSFVSSSKNGGAQPSLTLNIFDWAAKVGAGRQVLGSYSISKYGAQQSSDPWIPDLGNGIRPNGTTITGNDPTDAYVPNSPANEQAWIQHLVNTFGNSQSGGVQYYTLGNEPGSWAGTHGDIHPAGDTMTELRDRTIAYASMVKSVDPGAKILGPEEWGWSGYFVDGADAAAGNWGATYGGLPADAWLLKQLHDHDAVTGQRLLDYFTLHYYPQSGEYGNDVSTNMELLRNRSTRSLWDPNYVDESWIGTTGINGGKVNLVHLMQNWVNTYYPGTKIGVTEYSWGADGNMNGATAQADVWGIFGREKLDLANRWATPNTGSPTYLAMKMYRNYDGNDSAFGGTSVGATVANPDQVSAFASTRASDGALTVMVVNKNLFNSSNPSATTPVTLNVSHFAGLGSAHAWQLAAINPNDQTHAAITHLADIPLSGNSLTINVPMESVTLFVIEPAPAAPGAPTGLTATGAESRVSLSWTPVSGAASYNVYRGTTSASEALLQAGIATANYSDTAVTNGTTYYYRVTAVNGTGESPLSTEASATPQWTLPAAPNNLIATPTSTSQVKLTWADNSNVESAFVVEWATDSGFTTGVGSASTGADATTFNVTGLTESTTYYFRVRATNPAGPSANSNTASATTQRPPSGNGLLATYFDNRNFTGTRFTQTAAAVDFEWGTGAPAAGIGADTFSVRWTGQLRAVESGSYRFRTLSDNGIRIWVDGKRVINNWTSHRLATNTSVAVSLTAGQKYDVRVEYYDMTGPAVAKLMWQRPGQADFEVIPQARLYAPPNGLTATYFNNTNFTGTHVTRIDPSIGFNWGAVSPAPGITPGTFSARWTGQLLAAETGPYQLRTSSDEGVRVWINGKLVINHWTAHRLTDDTASIDLVAGQRNDIKIEYFDRTGPAVLDLDWLRPGRSNFESVAAANLFST